MLLGARSKTSLTKYPRMYLIGLTGGIGSGKSTVCGYFKELGCPIIDADVIAHKGTDAFCVNIFIYDFCQWLSQATRHGNR